MKKSTILLLLQFFIGTMYGQHLMFEGIPIDGTISEFQTKLYTKGFKLNRTESQNAPIGQRKFNGKLHGYPSIVTVYYAKKSKIVYQIKASIYSSNQDLIQSIFKSTIDTIRSGYYPQICPFNYTISVKEDTTDGRDLHIKYEILYFEYDSSNNIKSVWPYGSIEVNPTVTYHFGINRDTSKYELYENGYAINFTYVDWDNNNNILPSEKVLGWKSESRCDEQHAASRIKRMLDHFYKGCYRETLDYAEMLLDYYRYDCIPNAMLKYGIKENELDEFILFLNKKRIGEIKAGGNSKLTEVYKGTNNETGRQFIEFDYDGSFHHIMMDKDEVYNFITTLEELRGFFTDKSWTKKTKYNLPVSYSDATFPGWKKKNLFVYIHNDILEITTEENRPWLSVFKFHNINEIDELRIVLHNIKWE